MKRTFLTLCIALMSVCAFAQKGTTALGVNLSYGTEISNVGLGVKGQYNFTDAIRGQLSFDYFFKKDYVSMWDINADVHYLFPLNKGFTVYPLVGLTYTHWKADLPDVYDELLGGGDSSEGRFGGNVGGGVQYDINSSWAVNFEIKYQILGDGYGQAVFGFGAAYKF